MREAGPYGACAVLCSRQRGQTSPELAHFWALGVWLRLGSAQGRSASAQQRCARDSVSAPGLCAHRIAVGCETLHSPDTQPHILYR